MNKICNYAVKIQLIFQHSQTQLQYVTQLCILYTIINQMQKNIVKTFIAVQILFIASLIFLSVKQQNSASINCPKPQELLPSKCVPSGQPFAENCQEKLFQTRKNFNAEICLKKQNADVIEIFYEDTQALEYYSLSFTKRSIEFQPILLHYFKDPQRLFTIIKTQPYRFDVKQNANIWLSLDKHNVIQLSPRQERMYRKDIINKIECLFEENREMKAKANALDRNKIRRNHQTIVVTQSDRFGKEKQGNVTILNKLKLDQASSKIAKHNEKYYYAERIDKNVRLTFILNSQVYDFVRPYALESGKITRVSVKQVKTTWNGFYGISTNQTLGMKSSFLHADSITYSGGSGYIYQNGGNGYAGPVIVDGDTVTVIADLIEWRVLWQINGKQVDFTEISPLLRAKPLFFIISMQFRNDEVEIIDYY